MALADRYIIYIFSCVILLACAGVLARDIITRGEGREALVAQSMFETGNYILPSGYAEDIPSKPPMLHWMISFFSFFSGEVSSTTARLPSAFCYIIVVCLFYRFLKARFGGNLAFLTAIILTISVEFFRSGTTCRVDMVFSAFLIFGLLSFYKWYELGFKTLPYFAILFFTLAVLSKGPVGIILPALIITVHLLLVKQPKLSIVAKCTELFLPVLVFSSIWYLLAYTWGGEGFWDKFYSENFGRFLGNAEEEPHSKGIFYLPLSIIIGLMPGILLAVPAIYYFIRNFGSSSLGYENHASFKKFSIISILVFLVFFSLPSGKRSVYLLPVYPFLAFQLALIIQAYFVNLSTSKINQPPYFRAFMMLTFISFCVNFLIIRPYNNNLSPRNFAEFLNVKYAKDKDMYSFLNEFYALSFYMKRKIYRLSPGNLPENALILIFRDKIEQTEEVLGRRLLIQAESENQIEKPGKTLIAAKIE